MNGLRKNTNFIYNLLFCCKHTGYRIGIVSEMSLSCYVASAKHYQSRSYIHPRSDSTELAEAVPIDPVECFWPTLASNFVSITAIVAVMFVCSFVRACVFLACWFSCTIVLVFLTANTIQICDCYMIE